MKILSDKIKKAFAAYDAQLNAKVTKCELQKNDDGVNYYEAPVPLLSSGGATVIIDGTNPAITLEAPAKAEFAVKKVHPKQVIYRVAFNVDDAAKAEVDDSYFNMLVEPILKEAVSRYESTFGGSDVIRYGKTFCTISDLLESGEYVELRLVGNWASNREIN